MVGAGNGKPAASAAVTAAAASSPRPITTMFRLTLTATMLPSGLRAELHRGFFITAPKYTKASFRHESISANRVSGPS
jgi:hypothetical protein